MLPNLQHLVTRSRLEPYEDLIKEMKEKIKKQREVYEDTEDYKEYKELYTELQAKRLEAQMVEERGKQLDDELKAIRDGMAAKDREFDNEIEAIDKRIEAIKAEVSIDLAITVMQYQQDTWPKYCLFIVLLQEAAVAQAIKIKKVDIESTEIQTTGFKAEIPKLQATIKKVTFN